MTGGTPINHEELKVGVDDRFTAVSYVEVTPPSRQCQCKRVVTHPPKDRWKTLGRIAPPITKSKKEHAETTLIPQLNCTVYLQTSRTITHRERL